jgi:hypothetical protein
LRRGSNASAGILRGTGVLATIGVVGLFGTVWGIINSFIGISKAHTTNLAVVAPGIAEALLYDSRRETMDQGPHDRGKIQARPPLRHARQRAQCNLARDLYVKRRHARGVVRNVCCDVSAPKAIAFKPSGAPLPPPKPAIACTS